MSEERTLTKQEDLARKIAMAQGIYKINRLILSFRRQEMDDPVFQQYFKEREIEIETIIQNWEKE